MFKRFTRLSFVIGLFFTVVSVILLVNAVSIQTGAGLNLYTAIVFLAFGLTMMFLERGHADDKS